MIVISKKIANTSKNIHHLYIIIKLAIIPLDKPTIYTPLAKREVEMSSAVRVLLGLNALKIGKFVISFSSATSINFTPLDGANEYRLLLLLLDNDSDASIVSDVMIKFCVVIGIF